MHPLFHKTIAIHHGCNRCMSRYIPFKIYLIAAIKLIICRVNWTIISFVLFTFETCNSECKICRRYSIKSNPVDSFFLSFCSRRTLFYCFPKYPITYLTRRREGGIGERGTPKVEIIAARNLGASWRDQPANLPNLNLKKIWESFDL
jgi:hypothetical protein